MRRRKPIARTRGLAARAKSFPSYGDGFAQGRWDDSAALPFISGGLGGRSTVWPEPNQREVEYWCDVHPVAHACVYEIGTTFAEPEIRVGRRQDGERVAFDSHPTLDLLENPNPYMNGKQFRLCGAVSLAVSGLWYIQKVRGSSDQDTTGRLRAIYTWPASWVAEEREPDGAMAGKVRGYRVHGRPGVIPPENMIRNWLPQPGDFWAPSSMGRAAYNDIRMDAERENYQAEMVTNGPVPGVWINVGSRPIGDPRKFEEDLQNRFGRGRRGGANVYGGEGAGITESPGLRDMDWPGMSSLSETRICASFQVPPILIHVRAGLDRATYANYALAQKSFGFETMRPLWELAGDGLTRGLLLSEGLGDLEIWFDYEELPIFQEDESLKQAQVMERLAAGIISKNEARIELGYDPWGPEHDGPPAPPPSPFGGMFGGAQPDDGQERPDQDDDDSEDDDDAD